MEWSLLPNALRPFKIYCAPSNLGIRTWICRLNLLRGLFFQAWGSLTSLKSQTRYPQVKVPPGGLVLKIFTSWKVHRRQSGLNPRILDLEASTLPRDHRGRHNWYIVVWHWYTLIFIIVTMVTRDLLGKLCSIGKYTSVTRDLLGKLCCIGKYTSVQ